MIISHVDGRSRRRQAKKLRDGINQQGANNDKQTNKLNDYEDSDSDVEEDGSDNSHKKVKIVMENDTSSSSSSGQAASSFFGNLFASHQPTVQVDQLDEYFSFQGTLFYIW